MAVGQDLEGDGNVAIDHVPRQPGQDGKMLRLVPLNRKLVRCPNNETLPIERNRLGWFQPAVYGVFGELTRGGFQNLLPRVSCGQLHLGLKQVRVNQGRGMLRAGCGKVKWGREVEGSRGREVRFTCHCEPRRGEAIGSLGLPCEGYPIASGASRPRNDVGYLL